MIPTDVSAGRIFTAGPGGAGITPSNYAATVDDYLIDCRRRGLRPATIRYYGQVLERVGRACDLADPAGPRWRLAVFGRRSAALRDLLRAVSALVRWQGIPRSESWPGDLAAFKRDRIAFGYRSHGEYGRVYGDSRRTGDEAMIGQHTRVSAPAFSTSASRGVGWHASKCSRIKCRQIEARQCPSTPVRIREYDRRTPSGRRRDRYRTRTSPRQPGRERGLT